MTIHLDSRVVRSERLIAAPFGEEVAIADIDAEKYYALNPVATEVWNRIETETVVKDLCAILCADFDVTGTQCETDVIAFLEKLHHKGMIRIVS